MNQFTKLQQSYRDALVGRNLRIDMYTQQRGVGDIVEKLVEEFSINTLTSYTVSPASSKRSIEDVKLMDGDITILVDIKTEDINAAFHMPNIISVDRLRKTYKDPNMFIFYVFVKYKDTIEIETYRNIEILDVDCFLVEELDWSTLSIGNLGKGQLQLKKEPLKTTCGREAWMVSLQENVCEFLQKQQKKIEKDLKSWS